MGLRAAQASQAGGAVQRVSHAQLQVQFRALKCSSAGKLQVFEDETVLAVKSSFPQKRKLPWFENKVPFFERALLQECFGNPLTYVIVGGQQAPSFRSNTVHSSRSRPDSFKKAQDGFRL